jgi:hypothetical protein
MRPCHFLRRRGDVVPNRYGWLYLAPWQAACELRQWVVQIDHGVDSATEKVYWLHQQISQKVTLALTLFKGFG